MKTVTEYLSTHTTLNFHNLLSSNSQYEKFANFFKTEDGLYLKMTKS